MVEWCRLRLLAASLLVALAAQAAGEGANPYTNMHEGASTYANPEACITVVSAIRKDFQQAATSAQVRLFTAPAYWSPRSFRIEETTTVTSGAATVTAVAACIGSTGTPCGYLTAFPLMGASSPAFREVSSGTTLAPTADGTQDVYLQLAVTNTNPGNLSNLTGGSVTIRICGVVLQ
jgi:hypothetical protein